MALTNSQIKQLRSASPSQAGNRLGVAAELSGLTYSAIAESLGFTQSYLSDVVRGRYPDITLSNARRLAEFFGCQIEDLFPSRKAVA